jgi:hypothetical protein
MTKNGFIPIFSKTTSLFSEVVDQFTGFPFCINVFAKGKPNHPQPNMLIFFIFCFEL